MLPSERTNVVHLRKNPILQDGGEVEEVYEEEEVTG